MIESRKKWRVQIASILLSFLFLALVVEVASTNRISKLNDKSYKVIELILRSIPEQSDASSEPDSSQDRIMAAIVENNEIASSESTKGGGGELSKIVTRQNVSLPVVINTWAFTEGTKSAWNALALGGSALDAIEQGCSKCEDLQCDGTVGFGGSPDENGETTLDAMIMDGETHSVGAVGCLRRVKNAIGVARKIMEHTGHTLLVGELATNFAIKMGFPEENLTTTNSQQMHDNWKDTSCQPNFWRNVRPDPTTSCGPYSSISSSNPQGDEGTRPKIDRYNHDTISMVVIDRDGRIASGTSSNGARHKIPGRVGDAPITGAGSYVDKEVGGAGATGDGDIMARFLPSLIAVEEMRRGKSPEEAARYAISRITAYFPNFSGALVAVNLKGEIGAACHNIPNGFPYSYVMQSSSGVSDVKVDIAQCI